METSNLSHIENAPDNPMELFTQFYDEVKQYSDPNLFMPIMCIASRSDDDEILNRNVILRKFDEQGWMFVTERNTKKYKDFMKNPFVAATILWIYSMNGIVIYRQVRITGQVIELDAKTIAAFYDEEMLPAKIRSKICECGASISWNDLKKSHDKVLENYRNGKELLARRDSYTAMKIIPEKVDFYFAKEGEVADRVKYTKSEGNWKRIHVAA